MVFTDDSYHAKARTLETTQLHSAKNTTENEGRANTCGEQVTEQRKAIWARCGEAWEVEGAGLGA